MNANDAKTQGLPEKIAERLTDDPAEIAPLAALIREELLGSELFKAACDMLAIFDKDHAMSRFNWGSAFLRAQDIRELNEVPLRLRAALNALKVGRALAPEGGEKK